jgi:hypothetical protein
MEHTPDIIPGETQPIERLMRDGFMTLKPHFYLALLGLGLAGIAFGNAMTPVTLSILFPGQAASGTIEISFLFNNAEGVVPSYQIAIWLEYESGEYVKTLFVSEYLSGGGYDHGDVCPDWAKLAHWEKAQESEFDAATRPTPPIGARTLKFECEKRGIAPGAYRYCVQAHIVEKYNILYRGKITIGQGASETAGEVFYSPGKHPLAADILYDVRARYVPRTESNSSIKEEKP